MSPNNSHKLMINSMSPTEILSHRPPAPPTSSTSRRLFPTEKGGRSSSRSRSGGEQSRRSRSSDKKDSYHSRNRGSSCGSNTSNRRRSSRSKDRKEEERKQQQQQDSPEDPLNTLNMISGPDDISNSIDGISLLSEPAEHDSAKSWTTASSGQGFSLDGIANIDVNGHLNMKEHNISSGNGPEGVASQSKTCLPGGFFWRSKGSRKVSCADVASVSNGSDTLISVSSKAQMSGRDLHESAKVSLNVGEIQRALTMFESILNAQLRRFGQMHPSVGAAMHNVGVVRLRMGQNDVAESLLEEAVKIRKQTLGQNHLDVAASLSKLAAARVALRNFDDALANLRNALRIAKINVGDHHKTVAQILCKMACLFFEAGELLASQSTFTDALEIYRTVWSQDADRNACMSQLTDTLCNIGSIQNKRKQFAKAIISFSEALDLQRGILGHCDPHVIATLDNLAFSHSKNKNYSMASSYYKEMLRAQISHCGTFSGDCLDTLKKQTLMYEKLKDKKGAIEVTKKALKLQQTMLPPDNEVVLQTNEMLKELQEADCKKSKRKQ